MHHDNQIYFGKLEQNKQEEDFESENITSDEDAKSKEEDGRKNLTNDLITRSASFKPPKIETRYTKIDVSNRGNEQKLRNSSFSFRKNASEYDLSEKTIDSNLIRKHFKEDSNREYATP